MDLYMPNDSPLPRLGDDDYIRGQKYYTLFGCEYEVVHCPCDMITDYIDRFDEWMDSWPDYECEDDEYWKLYDSCHTKHQPKQRSQKKMF